jgi:hypothetical protein
MFRFCLNPRLELFEKIKANAKVRSTDAYELWEQAALAKYSKLWNVDSDATPRDNFDTVVTRAKIQPRQILLDKLMMLFCATGEVKYLTAAYEIGGDTSASEKLRKTAVDTYATLRHNFDIYMQEMAAEDVHWISNHPVSIAAANVGQMSPIAIAADAFNYIDRTVEDRLRAMESSLAADETAVEEFRAAADAVTKKFADAIVNVAAEKETQKTNESTKPTKKTKQTKKTNKTKQSRRDRHDDNITAQVKDESARDIAKAAAVFDKLASTLK